MTTQKLLQRRPALILMDDADDLWSGCRGADSPWPYSASGCGLSSLLPPSLASQQALIDAPLATTAWVVADPSLWSASVVRRFTLVLEVVNPPYEQRLRWLRQHAHDLLDERTAERLAANSHATLGVLKSAVQNVREFIGAESVVHLETATEVMVEGVLSALAPKR